MRFLGVFLTAVAAAVVLFLITAVAFHWIWQGTELDTLTGISPSLLNWVGIVGIMGGFAGMVGNAAQRR